MGNLIAADSLSPIRADHASSIKRDMVRPEKLRQEDYERSYDFQTIAFDCFFTVSGDIEIIGPPLLNFWNYFTDDSIKLCSGNKKYIVQLSEVNYTKRWCQDSLVLSSPSPKITHIELNLQELGDFKAHITSNRCKLFDNKRAILAMVKYDPIQWIEDWAYFYSVYHGSDSVLLYNNLSPHYTSQDLLEALQKVNTIKTVCVVDWPFPYGPQAGESGRWDSVFCKTGALQHAYRKYLLKAKSVINVDIDELVVCETHMPLHDMVESCSPHYIEFGGIWSSRPNELADPDIHMRRHKDYYYHGQVNVDTHQCPAKWAVVPGVCPEGAQWKTHTIDALVSSISYSNEIRFRHFRNLNTGWKGGRIKPLLGYNEDKLLMEAYRRIGWRV